MYSNFELPDSEVSRHAVPTVDMITAYKLDTLGPNLWTQFYLKGHQNLEASKKFRESFKKIFGNSDDSFIITIV